MTITHIFISYSHRDAGWFRGSTGNHHAGFEPELTPESRMASFIPDLEHALRVKNVSIWYDRKRLAGGDEWRAEIDGAIDRAQIAILLISNHFLSSDYIRNSELPRIKRRFDERELIVLPILVGRCDWDEEIPWLDGPQMLPGKVSPLVNCLGTPDTWDHAQNQIVKAIKKQIDRYNRPDSAIAAVAPTSRPSQTKVATRMASTTTPSDTTDTQRSTAIAKTSTVELKVLDKKGKIHVLSDPYITYRSDRGPTKVKDGIRTRNGLLETKLKWSELKSVSFDASSEDLEGKRVYAYTLHATLIDGTSAAHDLVEDWNMLYTSRMQPEDGDRQGILSGKTKFGDVIIKFFDIDTITVSR